MDLDLLKRRELPVGSYLEMLVEVLTVMIFAIIVLSTGGRFWLERFCKGASARSVICVLDQGVFISVIVIYDYLFLLSYSIWFLYLVSANPILLTFAHAG